MIGTILLIFDLLLLTIASVITFPLSRLIGLFDRHARDVFCLGFVKLAMKSFIFYAGAKVKYIGLENLPPKGKPVVYIGNHRGFYDIVALYAVVPDLTGFVAKEEMRKWPLIGWWMSSVYCLFLNRKNKREGLKTIMQGIEYVKKGVSMVIYPEGTRSKQEGVLGYFHPGSFKLATKPRADIIPVISSNSGGILDDHFPWIRHTTMCMEIGKPVPTEGLSDEEIQELPDLTHKIIYERLIANGKAIGSLPEDFEAPAAAAEDQASE